MPTPPYSTKRPLEQRTCELSGHIIPYTLKRSPHRRSIGLLVDEQGLSLSVPGNVSESWLHQVLQEKTYWILNQLKKQEKKVLNPQENQTQYRTKGELKGVDGEIVFFLGEPLTLRLIRELLPTPVVHQGKELRVYLLRPEHTRQVKYHVSLWYQKEALKFFQQRIAFYAPQLKVIPREVVVSKAKTQWGCATSQRVIRLNGELIKLPLEMLDYVVVHELAHLREMNHSAAFWKTVQEVFPDYIRQRNKLKAIPL